MLLIPIDPNQPFDLVIALDRPDSGTLKVQGRSGPTDGALTVWPVMTVLHSEPERRELDLHDADALEIELEFVLRTTPGTYVELTLQINQAGNRMWEQIITGMTDGEGSYTDQRSLRAGDAAKSEQGPPTQPENTEEDAGAAAPTEAERTEENPGAIPPLESTDPDLHIGPPWPARHT